MLETGAHPPLNFVVIGGGPTGVELAGAISGPRQALYAAGFPAYRPRPGTGAAGRGRSRILAAYPEDLSGKAVEQAGSTGR